MAGISSFAANLPLEQQTIWAKCFHPSGAFAEFREEEVEQSIPQRFEQIARKYGERLAVKTENQVLTYTDLNATANRVARAILSRQGSKPEAVALLLEKDGPLIVSMLGVLKAGKFFVLLDPSFPQARIAAVLEDSQAKLVITNRQNVWLAREVAGGGRGLMEFESIDCGISKDDLRLPLSPTALASIIYTSGSTGQPKGVMQTHRNLLHRVMLRTNTYHVCEHDRLSLLPASTSNAITATFVALANGAALLPFEVQRKGVARLASWLLKEEISICLISSALFRNLCENLRGNERFPYLRVLRLTSERAYKKDVDLYKEYFPSKCILSTGLSSTESGPLRKYLIDHKTVISGNEVPVGYAVKDKEVVLLDDTGKERGLNEVGEIAVSSRYLSPGYWRRPDLTAAKFLPDPKGEEERLYLTGDLGLMLSDGCLVYKGRKDFRVKVRGYGVEFAEVEKTLLEHASVREALVTGRQNPLGETELVAYFTSTQGRLTVTELRTFLEKKLPHYMIPSAFIMLDAMPITSNGKIDRRALPIPERSRPLDTRFVSPRNEVENILADIWSEVLLIDRIGVNDEFLDLGGNSLAATRVLSRVFKRYQLELPVQSLFQSPTIAEMAEVITQSRARKLNEPDLSRILAELESLSDKQAEQVVARQSMGDAQDKK
jgi:amino acid adenylation domain-containing protein